MNKDKTSRNRCLYHVKCLKLRSENSDGVSAVLGGTAPVWPEKGLPSPSLLRRLGVPRRAPTWACPLLCPVWSESPVRLLLLAGVGRPGRF